MPEKDLTALASAADLLTYVWVVVLSWWGGFASYIRKVRMGLTPRFSLVELIGELVISGFSGMITYFFAVAAEFDGYITAALVGMAGHMGSRIFYFAEMYIQKKFRLNVNVEIKADEKD